MIDMREWLIGIHVVISSVFFILGFYIIARSIYGRTKKLNFSLRDDQVSRLFVWFLYLQFILGFILYFVYHFVADAPVDIIENASDSRFWVISHFSVMIFTLILAQIGRIFIKSAKVASSKFSYSLFYYGVALVFSIFSSVLSFYR
jgi:hypothetical protein